jgi:hypothetical protein
MVDHGARAHATWSASATARNLHCPGALALSRFAPEQKESIHAARGTACHQISEKCLAKGLEPSVFLGATEHTKEHAIVIDEELVTSAEMYVEYCRGIMAGFSEWWLEERFSLHSLNPPFDAGGTGDFVSYDAENRTLEIVDLKNGMGVVDVNENPQLRTYALGALLAHPKLKVDTVTVTIVQPRAPHRDGQIRSETFHVADLVEWTSDLLDAMYRSKQAEDEFDEAGGNSVLLDDWAQNWLRPGKCTFCPAEGACPTNRRSALNVAKVWFEPDTGEAKIGNAALDQSPEALGRDLDLIPMLEDWIKARRALAHSLVEQGTNIPTADGQRYYLADKIGNRKWSVDEALLAKLLQGDGIAWLEHLSSTTDLEGPALQKAVAEAVAQYKLGKADVYAAPEIKSPAQLEKVLGAKRKALVEPFVTKPVTGTNLVRSNRTSRPAAKSVAGQYFEKQ